MSITPRTARREELALRYITDSDKSLRSQKANEGRHREASRHLDERIEDGDAFKPGSFRSSTKKRLFSALDLNPSTEAKRRKHSTQTSDTLELSTSTKQLLPKGLKALGSYVIEYNQNGGRRNKLSLNTQTDRAKALRKYNDSLEKAGKENLIIKQEDLELWSKQNPNYIKEHNDL